MKPHRLRRKLLLIILLFLVLIVGVLLIDSNTRIVTTEYVLRYPNLPEPFDGFRIAVLSDIHASVFGENNSRLISKVTEAQPDIIVITGDIIDGSKKPTLKEQLAIAEALIERLSPIANIYYITGNHEWDSGGVKQLLTMLGERVCVMRNQYDGFEKFAEDKISSGVITIAGIDDPNGPADMVKPEKLISDIRDRAGHGFLIVLEHRNNNLPLYSELEVDLVISGHAHGGIIRLPFTDGLIGQSREWMPTFTSGVYTMGNTNMVVSRGIGNHTGLPRFLNNPEVVIVELRVE